jgi:hypothetical protein
MLYVLLAAALYQGLTHAAFTQTLASTCCINECYPSRHTELPTMPVQGDMTTVKQVADANELQECHRIRIQVIPSSCTIKDLPDIVIT